MEDADDKQQSTVNYDAKHVCEQGDSNMINSFANDYNKNVRPHSQEANYIQVLRFIDKKLLAFCVALFKNDTNSDTFLLDEKSQISPIWHCYRDIFRIHMPMPTDLQVRNLENC